MSLIRKHGAVLQAWACLDLVKQCKQLAKDFFFGCRNRGALRITSKLWTFQLFLVTLLTYLDTQAHRRTE